ncbi:MAG: TIGR01777 family oxidoreductase [Candidatus Binatia bacterium]
MRLVIAGGTGFIGSALCARLIDLGHSLTILARTRSPGPILSNKDWIIWQPGSPGPWEEAIDGVDGVINLAGEPIARRWTQSQKERIRKSRVDTTRDLVTAIEKAKARPKFLLNSSAVGYYGPRGDEPVTEDAEPGSDFLSRVCIEWEEEAKKAEAFGVRVIRLRTGVVMGRGGGALAKMVPPFKLFIGGPLGTGKQWMSWIQMEDEIGLMVHLMERPEVMGAINATAPGSVTMKEFCQTLGKVLRRPSWAPVPAFVLRVLMGEMSDMVLTGQRVLPVKAQESGYVFKYPNLSEALQACLPL